MTDTAARTIAKELKGLLEYEKTLGLSEVKKTKIKRGTASAKSRATANDDSAVKPGEPIPVKAVVAKAPVGDKEQALNELRSAAIGDCKRCKLCKGRSNIVFGVGNPRAELMFIGEGPGADEDKQGIPFVGRAGQLLTKIIEAMGFKREDVYIANIVKCRPPQNRNPEPDEVKACIPFLIQQVNIVAPKAIVCLGSVATQNLLGTEDKITKLRGVFTKWNDVPVMPTYHPAFLLRNPAMKKPVWEDMQLVMQFLGKSGPREG